MSSARVSGRDARSRRDADEARCWPAPGCKLSCSGWPAASAAWCASRGARWSPRSYP